MFLELLDADDSICEAEWTVEKAEYDFHRLYYVKSGEVRYITDNENLLLKPFHMYIFPRGIRYRLEHNPKNPLNHLWMHIRVKPELLNQFVEYDLKVKSEVGCLLDAFKFMLFDGRNMEILPTVSKLLIQVLHSKGAVVFNNANKTDNAVYYINQNIYSKITLDGIAKAANYAKGRLTEFFVKETGLTPMKYVERAKMQEAVKLLADGYTVTEISDLLRFNDPNNFSRSFKKFYGKRPRNYLSK